MPVSVRPSSSAAPRRARALKEYIVEASSSDRPGSLSHLYLHPSINPPPPSVRQLDLRTEKRLGTSAVSRPSLCFSSLASLKAVLPPFPPSHPLDRATGFASDPKLERIRSSSHAQGKLARISSPAHAALRPPPLGAPGDPSRCESGAHRGCRRAEAGVRNRGFITSGERLRSRRPSHNYKILAAPPLH